MKFVSLSIVLIFALVHTIYAQTITMSDFLETVKQSHPFFASESLSAEIVREGQQGELGAQDWALRSSTYYTYQKQPSVGLGAPEQVSQVAAEIATAKALWSTGGRFSVTWSSEYTDQTIPGIVIPFEPNDIVIPAGPAQLYGNRLYLTYTQPLLQNFGGKLDRLAYELGDYEVDFTQLELRENQEQFVLDLSESFVDWALISERRRVANDRLELAQEQLRQTKRKRAANLVERVDVLRAEDAVRIVEQTLVLVESQWKAKQAELAVLSQIPELYQIEPEYDLHARMTLPSADEAVQRLTEQSRILIGLRVVHDQLVYLTHGYSEQSRPQLFLTVGAGLRGLDDELAASLEITDPDVLVSLDFRYPLGNRTARADIAQTELQIKQIEKDYEDTALDLEAGVRSLLIAIEEMERVLALNEDQIASARAKTREEQRLYDQGRSDLTFVIQSQDGEAVSKLTYAENAATYHRLVLQYRGLMDELLPEQE
jgi:outer membrane protein TolC